LDKIEPSTTVKTWNDLIKLETEFSQPNAEWVFRGEAKHREPKTSLQRVCEEFGINGPDIPRLEAQLVNDFQRHYPVYARTTLLDFDDTIYWISLMRHYGAPTRFLDFSYSFFVASFFALERSVESGRDAAGSPQYCPAAVWAISKGWLTEHMARVMKKLAEGKTTLCREWEQRKGKAFRRIFWERIPPIRTIFSVNPYHYHKRLHVQQGLFLCPGDVSVSFEKNLLALNGWKDNRNVRLIMIDPACRREVLWKFQRAGLSNELLFPGLEGFARSLCIAGPLLYEWRQRLENSRARPESDDLGGILWDKIGK
jgi:hypothetical protein